MKNKFKTTVTALLLSATFCIAEGTEPISLDDIVITPTGSAKEIFNTSLSVSLITEQQMDNQTIVFIEDIFKNEPGVDAVTAGPGSVHPIIRGLHGERILILVDGIRLSEERPGGNHIFSLDPAQIKQVEIVRGPSSVLYGSDAIGGVINFITKRSFQETGSDFRIGGDAEIQYQDNGEGWKEIINLKMGKDNFNAYFGGTYQDTKNIKNRAGEVKNSFYDGFTVWTGGNYIGDNWETTLDYSLMNADIGIPAPSTFDKDYFKGEKHQRMAFGLKNYNILSFIDELSIDFGWQRHNRHRYRRKTTGIPEIIVGDMQVEIWLDIDTYTLKPQAIWIPNETHTFTYGLDSFYEDASSDRVIKDTKSSWVNPKFSGVPVIPDSYKKGIGVFAQDDIKLSELLIVTPGLRFDYIKAETDGNPRHAIKDPTSNTSHALTGNLGLLYKINNVLNWYGNIGRAFRAPTLLELYFYGPHDVANDIGNPDLKPEESWNFDTGIKVKTEKMNAIFSIFYNTIDDYIAKEKQADGDYMYKNYSKVELYGAEAGLDYDLGYGLSVFANISAVDGKDKNDDQYLPAIPPLHSSYGGKFETKIYNKYGYWLELTGESAAKQNHLGPNERETSGYTVGNIRTGLNINNNWKIVFAVENFTDKLYEKHTSAAWQEFGISDQAGRNVKLQAKVSF